MVARLSPDCRATRVVNFVRAFRGSLRRPRVLACTSRRSPDQPTVGHSRGDPCDASIPPWRRLLSARTGPGGEPRRRAILSLVLNPHRFRRLLLRHAGTVHGDHQRRRRQVLPEPGCSPSCGSGAGEYAPIQAPIQSTLTIAAARWRPLRRPCRPIWRRAGGSPAIPGAHAAASIFVRTSQPPPTMR